MASIVNSPQAGIHLEVISTADAPVRTFPFPLQFPRAHIQRGLGLPPAGADGRRATTGRRAPAPRRAATRAVRAGPGTAARPVPDAAAPAQLPAAPSLRSTAQLRLPAELLPGGAAAAGALPPLHAGPGPGRGDA